MALADKHYEVLEQYFTCWNKTEAYQRVFPKVKRNSAASNAYRLFEMPEFQEAISRRLTETVMSADEVLMRLADHARGDVGDYIMESGGDLRIDINAAKKAKRTHLIKKVTQRRFVRKTDDSEEEETTITIEMYDAQAALVHIGKHHRLFTDKVELSGDIDIAFVNVDVDKL